jgi:hypothetical protein
MVALFSYDIGLPWRCEISAHGSHFASGIKAPQKFRHKGATEIPA